MQSVLILALLGAVTGSVLPLLLGIEDQRATWALVCASAFTLPVLLSAAVASALRSRAPGQRTFRHGSKLQAVALAVLALFGGAGTLSYLWIEARGEPSTASLADAHDLAAIEPGNPRLKSEGDLRHLRSASPVRPTGAAAPEGAIRLTFSGTLDRRISSP